MKGDNFMLMGGIGIQEIIIIFLIVVFGLPLAIVPLVIRKRKKKHKKEDI